jgi:hypothetical protein
MHSSTLMRAESYVRSGKIVIAMPTPAKKTVARKTAPGVSGGRVQKKNHWGPTDDPFKSVQPELRLEQKKPGPGFRHVVSRADVKAFIEIIPDWPELSRGIDMIKLAPGRYGNFGTYWYGYTEHGVIYLRAWEEDLHKIWSNRFFQANRLLIERLGVPYEQEEDLWRPAFTENTARAFMLLDVFLHEIGHHHDRMRTRSKKDCPDGEPYAERFALELGERMWNDFAKRFPIY